MVRSVAFASTVGFSSHERENVKERVEETCWDETVKDLERREAVGRLLFDLVNVSPDHELETVRLRLLLLFHVTVSEPVAMIDGTAENDGESPATEVVLDLRSVGVHEMLCENDESLVADVVPTDGLVEGEKDDVVDGEGSFDDVSLITPFAFFGTSQMFCPSYAAPKKAFGPLARSNGHEL